MSRRNPETLNLAMDYAAVMEACAAYVMVQRPSVRDPESVVRIMRPMLAAASGGNCQETFFVILLDTKNHMIGIPREATRGLLDRSFAHPREIFRAAVTEAAAAVILIHNHPSGDPTPSREDIDTTRRLVEAGGILGIRVTDHVVIGRPTDMTPGFVSLREAGLVDFDSKRQ